MIENLDSSDLLAKKGEKFARILEFFYGVFLSFSIFGAIVCFFILKALFLNSFLAIIISCFIAIFFLFFAFVSKSLVLLLRHSLKV